MRRAALLGLVMICVAVGRPAPANALVRTDGSGGEADVMAWTHARLAEDMVAVQRLNKKENLLPKRILHHFRALKIAKPKSR